MTSTILPPTETSPAPQATPTPVSPATTQSAEKPASPAPDVNKDKGSTSEQRKAPEKYEFKSPLEGHNLPPAVVNAYSEVAKALNLPQESAQLVLDKLLPVMLEHAGTEFKTRQAAWEKQAKESTVLGGEKFAENLAIARAPLAKYPQLTAFLNESGLGSHPQFLELMFEFGKAISGDRHVAADRRGPSDADSASKLYPNSPKPS